MRAWFDRKRKQYEGKNTWKADKKASFALLVETFDQLADDKQEEVQQPLPLFPEMDHVGTIHEPEQFVDEIEEGESHTEEQVEQVAEDLSQPVSHDSEPEEKEWMDMMSKVWDFVRLNHREPLAMFTNEVQCAEWLKAQKEALRQNVLSESHREELLHLRDYLC